MDDLVRWLGEQIDNDEQRANCAAMDPFGALEAGLTVAVLDSERTGDPAEAVAALRWAAGYVRERGPRPTLHDPLRALREAEAKRLLVRDLLAQPHFLDEREWYGCQSVRHSYTDEQGAVFPELDGRMLPTGKPCTCGRDEDVARRLAVLAAVYSDRPGYRAEWKP